MDLPRFYLNSNRSHFLRNLGVLKLQQEGFVSTDVVLHSEW